MNSLYSKFDSLIKDFCKEISSTYSLNEQDLFSIWKGEKPVKKQTTIKQFTTSTQNDLSQPEKSSQPSISSQPEDSDTEITKENQEIYENLRIS